MDRALKTAELLFKHAYPIYRPVYFGFKRWSDRREIGLLRRLVRPGMRVVDIGANIGFYVRLLADAVGSEGQVLAFEPDPKNFAHLQRTVADRSNTVLHHAAVAAEKGMLKLYLSDRMNVDHRTYEPESYDRVVNVPAVRVDDALGELRVDLVKMDIQGFEMSALPGMRRTLTGNRDLILLSEFWPYGLQRAGSSVRAYKQALEEHGFAVFLFDEGGLTELSESRISAIEHLPHTAYFNILAARDRSVLEGIAEHY